MNATCPNHIAYDPEPLEQVTLQWRGLAIIRQGSPHPNIVGVAMYSIVIGTTRLPYRFY